MANGWRFWQDDELRWRWAQTAHDEPLAESPTAFERPTDCMLDAVRYAVQRRRSMTDADQ